jgi:hypothetical protein
MSSTQIHHSNNTTSSHETSPKSASSSLSAHTGEPPVGLVNAGGLFLPHTAQLAHMMAAIGHQQQNGSVRMGVDH